MRHHSRERAELSRVRTAMQGERGLLGRRKPNGFGPSDVMSTLRAGHARLTGDIEMISHGQAPR